MVVSLIGLALVVIVLILAATAISASRGNSKEGGNIMMKNVYIYVVLFATLLMIRSRSNNIGNGHKCAYASADYHH